MRPTRVAAVAAATAGAVAVLASPGSAASPEPGFGLLGPVHLSASAGHYVYVQATCTGSLGVMVQLSQPGARDEITGKGHVPLPCTGQLEVTKLSLQLLSPGHRPIEPGEVSVRLESDRGDVTAPGQAVAQP